MYNFTTYAMQLNELHEDQKSKVSHFPLLEKWRERYASYVSLCWLIKWREKYSKSPTVYSSVKMAGKYCNSCTVYSPVKWQRNRLTGLLSAHASIKMTEKIGQQVYCLRTSLSNWRENKSVFCLLVHQNIGENLQLIR